MQLDKICRACLTICAEMRSIYKAEELNINGSKINLAQVLMTCATIEVSSLIIVLLYLFYYFYIFVTVLVKRK